MIKDGRPYTPLPNAKGRGKKNGRGEFYFKWSNLYDNFRFTSLADYERLGHGHIFSFIIIIIISSSSSSSSSMYCSYYCHLSQCWMIEY
jgi:hypothetical protein